MDQSVINVGALTVSFLALAASAAGAYRQLRLMRGANLLPIILEGFRETRTEQFARAREYIRDRLALDHDPSLGLRGLPDSVKYDVRMVVFFFDDLGKLVAYGAVDERLIVGAYGGSVTQVWRSVAPYVERERELSGGGVAVYLEDLAARAHRRPASQVNRRLLKCSQSDLARANTAGAPAEPAERPPTD